MKNSSLDLNAIRLKLSSLTNSIWKYHTIISFLAVAVFLIYAVLVVNMILNNTFDPNYAAEQQLNSVQTRFDDETIVKINELRSRQENPSLELPGGRRNPFME